MLRPLLVASAVLLASCEREMPLTTEPPPEAVASGPQGAATGNTASAAPAPIVPDEQSLRVLADLGAPYAAADLENGRSVFARCKSCHTLAHGGARMAGPNLWGVIGAKVGAKEGFAYSSALQDAGFAWDAANLDKWLEDPKAFLPGNKMSFAGIRDQADRRDLIAYIAVQAQAAPVH